MKGYSLVMRPRNKIILKNLLSDQGRLFVSCRILREKFYPELGIEPRPLAFRTNALTN